jgi:upstream activation factor subunit UAF30
MGLPGVPRAVVTLNPQIVEEHSMAEKKSKSGGASNSAFMAPVRPDEVLAAIVGSAPLPRTEITKKIWDYIRQHALQDPKDKRTIRADAKLRPLFGGKDSVSMFELTKKVNEHVRK